MGLELDYRSAIPTSVTTVGKDEITQDKIFLDSWHLSVLDDVEVVLHDPEGHGIYEAVAETLEWTTGAGDVYDNLADPVITQLLQGTETWFSLYPKGFSMFRLFQDPAEEGTFTLERYSKDGGVMRYKFYFQESQPENRILVRLRPEKYFDPYDNAATYTFDVLDRLVKITDARGVEVRFAWTHQQGVGGWCNITYYKGSQQFTDLDWGFAWGNNNRVTSIWLPKTKYVTKGSGLLMDLATEPHNARTLTFTYHGSSPGLGFLHEVIDSRLGADSILTTTYVATNLNGEQRDRVATQVDRHANTHTFSYTAPGGVFTIDYSRPDTQTEDTQYKLEVNSDGLPTLVTVTPGSTPRTDNGDIPEPASLTWQYQYGSCSCGLPTNVTTPTGRTYNMTYDSLGNMISYRTLSPKDSEGEVTYSWTYEGLDKAGAVTSYNPPTGAASITYTYGPWLPRSDNLWGFKSSEFKKTTSPISVQGGPSQILSTQVKFKTNGQIDWVKDVEGLQYTFTYAGSDVPGALLLKSVSRSPITGDVPKVVTYTLDNLGRIEQINTGTENNETVVEFERDAYGRATQVTTWPSTDPGAPSYVTIYNRDRFENIAVTRYSNLDESGQPPKYDDGSGSPRQYIRSEWHYYYEELWHSYIDRRALPEPNDLQNPTDPPNPWMAHYEYHYKENGDLSEVTLPNGSVNIYETDGYGTLYRIIADQGGENVELGRYYFDDDLHLKMVRKLVSTSPDVFATTEIFRNHGGQGYEYRVVDPTGISRENQYDTWGRTLETVIKAHDDAIKKKTTAAYDEIGRPVTVQRHLIGGGESADTTFEYSKRSQILEITAPLGRKSFRYYDGYGRLKRARDNLSGTESNTNEIELQYVQGRDFVLNLISKIFDESDDAVPPAGTRKEYITTYMFSEHTFVRSEALKHAASEGVCWA